MANTEREPISQKVNFKLKDKETEFYIYGGLGILSSDPWETGIYPTHDTVWEIKIAQNENKKDAQRIANINVIKDPIITDYHLEIPLGLEIELLTPTNMENPWVRLAKENKQLLKEMLLKGIKHSEEELKTFASKKIINDIDITRTGLFDDTQIDEQIFEFATPLGQWPQFDILLKYIPVFVDMESKSESPSAKEILEIAVEGRYEVNVKKDDETGNLIARYTDGHSIVQAGLNWIIK